jgi:tRNA-splicing ligase RtcB
MIHSGSRNLGKRVADHYNALARAANAAYRSNVPDEWELAFFPVDSDLGRQYLNEMDYCVRFARANRNLMMECVEEALATALVTDIEAAQLVSHDVSHNYALVTANGCVVHRKGATSAKAGETGIIPGSQGTASYIVTGKGNRDSMESCSHGAGRRLGRGQARRTLDLAAEVAALERAGVVHSVRTQADLDEAPSAYKDIDAVMAQQSDLVEIVERLQPLGVVKG